eukprot:jgi/Hompol1/6946/HPOL_000978-RA
MFPSALLLLSANILLAPQTAAHPLGVHINGAKAVDSVASGTASKAQLIIDGYDFSEYPTADVPPPINTTWNQFYGIDTTNEQIVAEFEWAIKIIQQVTGARPAYARPPFGDIDDRVRAVLAKMGMKPLIWNRDTFDWNLGNPNSGYQTQWVTGNFTQWISTANTIPVGFMSLEHDLYPQSAAQALPALSLVAAANYTMQTYATCSNTQPYLSVVAVPIPPMPPTYPQTLSVQVPSLPTQRPYASLIASYEDRLKTPQDIIDHPFFRDHIDFAKLRTPEGPKAPLVPHLESPADTSYFDDFSDPKDMERYKEVHQRHAELNKVGETGGTNAHGNAASASGSSDSMRDLRSAFVGFTFKHNTPIPTGLPESLSSTKTLL